MTAHALLSASGSKRWLSCTPSARLEATLPDQKRPPGSFDFSQEGTMAHSLAEAKLRHYYGQIGIEEYEKEYEIIKATPYYNDDFEANVDNYVLYVRSQIGEGDTPLFEQRVDFSDWVPDGFGTADVVILSKHTIRVIDLKFGKGVAVSAIDNTQLRLYALGAWSKFKEEWPDIRKSATPSTSQDSTLLAAMGRPSPSSSTGQTTSSNQKPRKRGAAQVSSSRDPGASSAKPKRNAAPAATTTQSSPVKSSKTPRSSAKTKSAKSSTSPNLKDLGQ